MKEVTINQTAWQQACHDGADMMLQTLTNAILEAVGGKLTGENLNKLNADQITLLGWSFLHEEVMDGGFVQLIHNGLGGFIFLNPFARAVRKWGLTELATMVNKGHKLYSKYHDALEQDCTDEEFMALFEQYPEFDDLDDEFVEEEEDWTHQIADYVEAHQKDFFTLTED